MLAPRHTNPSEATSSPEPLAGLHLLFVEDDADVREATEALLGLAGARVTVCARAEPAIAFLDGNGPCDLLLTDIVLPGPMNGLDIAVAARRIRPRLPVLLASGYADPSSNGAAALLAELPLLRKPFRRADLLRAVLAAVVRA